MRIKTSCNIGDIRNLSQVKLKNEIFRVVLMKPKISPEKVRITLKETNKMLDIKKLIQQTKNACPKRTILNGRRKICVNYHTNTDTLNGIVYRY